MAIPTNTIEQIREENIGIPEETSGRIPWIVYLDYPFGAPRYGIQYNDKNKKKGTQEPTIDGRVQMTLIEPLY